MVNENDCTQHCLKLGSANSGVDPALEFAEEKLGCGSEAPRKVVLATPYLYSGNTLFHPQVTPLFGYQTLKITA